MKCWRECNRDMATGAAASRWKIGHAHNGSTEGSVLVGVLTLPPQNPDTCCTTPICLSDPTHHHHHTLTHPHLQGFPSKVMTKLEDYGFIQSKAKGEYHANNQAMSKLLHKAIGLGTGSVADASAYEAYMAHFESAPPHVLRDCLMLETGGCLWVGCVGCVCVFLGVCVCVFVGKKREGGVVVHGLLLAGWQKGRLYLVFAVVARLGLFSCVLACQVLIDQPESAPSPCHGQFGP